MKITLEYYNHTCGDRCCDTYGYDVFVYGEKIGSIGEDAQELAELLNETFNTKRQMKQTAVEWLAETLRFANKELYAEMYEHIEQAKEIEKYAAQKYAEFAIECYRKELPVLEFDGWINLRH